MAEGGGLLNRYTAITRIVGSNPIPSAISLFPGVSAGFDNLQTGELIYRFASPLVSRGIILSPSEFGDDVGNPSGVLYFDVS